MPLMPRQNEFEELSFDVNTLPIVARNRAMKAEYTMEIPRDWPKWLRDQAELHIKAAAELIEVAKYLEENGINPERYEQQSNTEKPK